VRGTGASEAFDWREAVATVGKSAEEDADGVL
jgi:hypothetical protein